MFSFLKKCCCKMFLMYTEVNCSQTLNWNALCLCRKLDISGGSFNFKKLCDINIQKKMYLWIWCWILWEKLLKYSMFKEVKGVFNRTHKTTNNKKTLAVVFRPWIHGILSLWLNKENANKLTWSWGISASCSFYVISLAV